MFLNILRTECVRLRGFDPEIDWGKDGKLAKKRLKKYSFEEIRQLIDWYLNSKHFESLGLLCLFAFQLS